MSTIISHLNYRIKDVREKNVIVQRKKYKCLVYNEHIDYILQTTNEIGYENNLEFVLINLRIFSNAFDNLDFINLNEFLLYLKCWPFGLKHS